MRPRAIAVLLLLAAPGPIVAQDTSSNRYTLEDLGGVFVAWEVADACESGGVTASAYQADVANTLIDSEVGVLTREEMLTHPALPELRVVIDCASGNGGGAMAFSVHLLVKQSAQMIRDTQITLPEAVTWYATRVGVASQGSAVEDVRTALSEQVDAFVTAWTEINSDEGGA